MIHTFRIDDSLPVGRKLIAELKKHEGSVVYENPIQMESAPEGYMTLEEFRKKSKANARKILNENGIY